MSGCRAKRRGWLALGGTALAIALVWLYVLPALSRRATTAERLHRLDQQGIDASAMFYTDLPLMQRLLEKIEDR